MAKQKRAVATQKAARFPPTLWAALVAHMPLHAPAGTRMRPAPQVYKGVLSPGEFNAMADELISGPCIAFEVADRDGADCVEQVWVWVCLRGPALPPCLPPVGKQVGHLPSAPPPAANSRPLPPHPPLPSPPSTPTQFRQLCGPMDPELARVLRPNSLRALFGLNKIKNGVHCTDLQQDGQLETSYFFTLL